ncbi:MAG: hypothetical protein ACOCUI_02630, partial [bacterium]
MNRIIKFSLFSIFIIFSNCSCYGWPFGSLFGRNERISDKEIFEDFEKLEKTLNISFEIEELSKEDYKHHMKGAEELLESIDTVNENYFNNGNDEERDIRPIEWLLNGDYENYDAEFVAGYQRFITYLTFSNSWPGVKKPKEWRDEIKDKREELGSYYYIKSLDKIKRLRYSYVKDYIIDPDLGVDLGVVNNSPTILLQGIKEDKIRMIISF